MRIKRLNEISNNETIIEEKARKLAWESKEYDKVIQQSINNYGKQHDEYQPDAIWRDGFENGFTECARIFNIEHIVTDIEKYNL